MIGEKTSPATVSLKMGFMFDAMLSKAQGIYENSSNHLVSLSAFFCAIFKN
jgi:hypothetical protein